MRARFQEWREGAQGRLRMLVASRICEGTVLALLFLYPLSSDYTLLSFVHAGRFKRGEGEWVAPV